jgi:hypothetical protein
MISEGFRQLMAILEIVRSRVRKDAGVDVSCFYLTDKPGGTNYGYIQFSAGWEDNAPKVKNDPGIPVEALVPEKVLPIAQWIVKQVSKEHPEWFIQ